MHPFMHWWSSQSVVQIHLHVLSREARYRTYNLLISRQQLYLMNHASAQGPARTQRSPEERPSQHHSYQFGLSFFGRVAWRKPRWLKCISQPNAERSLNCLSLRRMRSPAQIQLCKACRDSSKKTQSCNSCQRAFGKILNWGSAYFCQRFRFFHYYEFVIVCYLV